MTDTDSATTAGLAAAATLTEADFESFTAFVITDPGMLEGPAIEVIVVRDEFEGYKPIDGEDIPEFRPGSTIMLSEKLALPLTADDDDLDTAAEDLLTASGWSIIEPLGTWSSGRVGIVGRTGEEWKNPLWVRKHTPPAPESFWADWDPEDLPEPVNPGGEPRNG